MLLQFHATVAEGNDIRCDIGRMLRLNDLSDIGEETFTAFGRGGVIHTRSNPHWERRKQLIAFAFPSFLQ